MMRTDAKSRLSCDRREVVARRSRLPGSFGRLESDFERRCKVGVTSAVFVVTRC